MKRAKLVAFVGPSLDRAEARRLGRCVVLPPAAQGDVWRALERYRPLAIALIDGVFELTPSVWHHELLDALSLGVAVFGASSMGALRAAELRRWGMVPVGRIANEYARGRRIDDSDVALLHTDAEGGFRPLTVPLVDAEHAVVLAKKEKVLKPAQAAFVLSAARGMHYTERTWPALAKQALGVNSRVLLEFVRRVRPSLKAEDARSCLSVARQFSCSGAMAPRNVPSRRSSFVRARRLLALGAREDGDAARAGLPGLLAGALVKGAGLAVSPQRVRALEQHFIRRGASPLRALQRATALAQEELAVELGSRLVPDGPSPLEGVEAAPAKRLLVP